MIFDQIFTVTIEFFTINLKNNYNIKFIYLIKLLAKLLMNYNKYNYTLQ